MHIVVATYENGAQCNAPEDELNAVTVDFCSSGQTASYLRMYVLWTVWTKICNFC